MMKPILTAADSMMAALLDCPKNKPLSDKDFRSIQALKVTACYIEVTRMDGGKSENSCSLSQLERVPDFSRLQAVEELTLYYDNCRQCTLPMWRQIQRALNYLPAVKKLNLGGMVADAAPVELKQCTELFSKLEQLTIEWNAECLLEQVPAELDALKCLRTNTPIRLEQLLALKAPALTNLRVSRICGLQSVEQLCEHFPMLETLWIGPDAADGGVGCTGCIELGKVGEKISRLVVSAPELGDWSGLKDSNVKELKLMNAEFDPEILAGCTRMKALELECCMPVREMPSLAALQELNYLKVLGCMITDYRFARGLKAVQVFDVERNNLEIADWEEEKLPEVLDCLADMPELLEFSAEKELIDNLLKYCPKHFRRYSNELRPDMLRLKA